jgi:hypothetical protein
MDEMAVALSQPLPVNESGELAVGQLPAGRGAQYAAHDPAVPAAAFIAGSAETRARSIERFF